jgi:hypothetical protein
MKKSSLILAIIFLISMSSFQVSLAQDKTKEEKDKELNGLIDEQKKAMVDQKKAQEEARKVMEKSRIEFEDALGNMYDSLNFDNGKYQKIFRDFRNQGNGWNFNNGEPFIMSPGVGFYGRTLNGDTETTTWDFTKSLKESSSSKDYVFDVDPGAHTVVMWINGDCKSGEIHIKIIMPDGKVYSDILIDESGNLNWRKSFVISDTDNKDKTGTWKFEINSSKATGYFKISLQTF